MRFIKTSLLLLIGLLIAGYLLTGVTEVRPGERVIVRRFGQVIAKPGPGLWIGLPWGIDRIDRVQADQVKHVAVGYQPGLDDMGLTAPRGQLLTGDHNLVNVQVVIHYSLDQDKVEDYVVQAERVDGLVARTAEAVLAEWVAGNTVDEVLIHGKARLPDFLVQRVRKRLEPYQLGVSIQSASVIDLMPPEVVKPAFDKVTRAQAGIRAQEYEARKEAERSRRIAEKDKRHIEEMTAAYVNERLRSAQTDAETFEKRRQLYHRLRQENPDVLASIWWDEMSRLLARMKETGRIDVLDNYLGADGLDITLFAPLPKKK